MNKQKRAWSLLLAVCLIVSMAVPAVRAEEAEQRTVTYNFDYYAVAEALKGEGGLPAGNNYVNGSNVGNYASFGSTDLTGEITAYYEAGQLNWSFAKAFYGDGTTGMKAFVYDRDFVKADRTNNKDTGFIRITAVENGYVALKIKNPGAGIKWSVSLKHLTAPGGAAVSNVYILPASTGDISAAIADARELGSVNYYTSTSVQSNDAPNIASTTSFVGLWTPGTAEEFLLVMEATEGYGDATGANMYPAQLMLTEQKASDADPGEFNFDYYTVAAGLKNGEKPAGNSGVLTSFTDASGNPNANLIGELEGYYQTEQLNWNFKEYSSTWVHPTNTANKHRLYLYSQTANDSKTQNNNDAGFLRFNAMEGDWMAFTIRNPGADVTRYLTLKHPTSIRGAAQCDVYILSADTADIGAALAAAEPIGSADFYNSAVGSGDAPNVACSSSYVGSWTPGSDEEYILVLKAAKKHESQEAAYLYMSGLTMGLTYVETVEIVDAQIALDNVIRSYVPRTMATSQVNGHDYAYIPLMGGFLFVYDLDADKLIDTETNCFATPRSIYVDEDGIVWLSGAGSYLYRYDPATLTGTQVAFSCTELFPGVSSFNAYGLTGDGNGNLYFGTYNMGYFGKYNKATGEVTRISEWLNTSQTLEPDAQHVGMAGVIYKDGYLYAGIDGDRNGDGVTSHEIVKFDLTTQTIVDYVDVSENVGAAQYLGKLHLVDDLLIGQTSGVAIAVDIDTLDPVQIPGFEDGFNGAVSDPVDGKVYMMNILEGGLLEYDPAARKAVSYGIPFTGMGTLQHNQCLATVPDIPGTCLVTVKNYTDRLDLVIISLENKTISTITDITNGVGSGNQLRDLEITPDGKTIYVSAYGNNNVAVYDVESGQRVKQFATYSHQTEGLHLYNGQLYGGHYGLAGITRIDVENGSATPLFTLETSVFPQHRMHPFTSGDGMVFAGTAPIKNRFGGVLTWYHIAEDRIYVAAGPDPEDVFYTDAGNLTGTGWYSALTGQLMDFDDDDDGVDDSMIVVDGVSVQRFTGLIENQSPNCIVYQDGYIYGSTTRSGGSSTTPISGNAVLFVYDVAAMKVIATYDLTEVIDGLTTPVEFVDVIAADPDVAGKFWGVISDTLFSFTFDPDTGFAVKEELSLGKNSYNHGSNAWKSTSIIFDREFMYVRFGSYGVYMVDKDDATTYYQLSRAVPKDMVLAADDNLYFVNNDNHLKVLRISETVKSVKDRAEAAATQAMIDALDAPENITLEDEAAIIAARDAYEDLSAEAKAAVDITRLVAAEAAVKPFRDAADKAAADAVIAKIDAIGTVTLNSEEAIQAAREAYDALSAAQQTLVTNAGTLTDAEAKLAGLKAAAEKEAADKAAADAVIAKINAIGTVTLNSKEAIQAAREAYNALSAAQQTLVTNAGTLTDAEAKLAGLKAAAEKEAADKAAADAVIAKIDAIGTVTLNSEEAIQAAREAYDALTAAQKALVTNLAVLEAAEASLEELRTPPVTPPTGDTMPVAVLTLTVLLCAAAATVLVVSKKRIF